MSDDRPEVLTRAISGFGLPGAPSPATTTVDDELWPRVLWRIRAERISGLAVQSAVSGWLDLSDEQATELLAVHRDAMTWCLSIERKLVGLADAFDDEGIGFAVLKGPSVAHNMYADPSLRSFGDLDLLVSTSDYERSCALLGRLGHVRRRPEPRPGFEVRFGKASVHTHPDDAIEVDLHRTLVLGPFGLWIDPQELLDRREPFLLGGRKLDRLDDTGMLLNVAMHAVLGAWPHRLVPIRDVAQVLHTGAVDEQQLGRWCGAWHVSAVIDRAFALSSELGSQPTARADPHRQPRPGAGAARACNGTRGAVAPPAGRRSPPSGRSPAHPGRRRTSAR